MPRESAVNPQLLRRRWCHATSGVRVASPVFYASAGRWRCEGQFADNKTAIRAYCLGNRPTHDHKHFLLLQSGRATKQCNAVPNVTANQMFCQPREARSSFDVMQTWAYAWAKFAHAATRITIVRHLLRQSSVLSSSGPLPTQET
jgi:hypothetical protein